MQNSFSVRLKRILTAREFVLLIALVVAGLVVSLFTPVFLKRVNILSMLMSITVEGLVAVGMVLLLACGQMDLSVGMNMAITGVLCGLCMTKGVPVVPAILIALLCSVAIGWLNGFLVAKIGLNSFITTLGMSCALEGLMLVASHGRSVTGLPEAFNKIGQGTIPGLGIQYPILVLLVIVLFADYMLRNNRAARQVFYIGSNEKAAKLSGMKVERAKIVCFCLCGLCSGIAGIMITARFGAASVTIGSDTAMDTITACIIGGASLNGGKGSVWASVLGALFLAMLSTALNLLGVNIYWQNFVTGVILIVAILFDALSEKKKAAGKTAL